VDKQNIYMNIVYQIASFSQDERTRVGAIIVEPDTGSIISSGYNDFPTSCFMKQVENKPERQERPHKYSFFTHAEVMAISSAANKGVSLWGCHMYTNGIPCTNCTRTIIPSGIEKIFVDKHSRKFMGMNWLEEAKLSMQMLDEVGIEVIEVDTRLIQPIRFVDGSVRT